LQRLNHHVFTEPEQVMENIKFVAEHLEKKAFSDKILKPIPTKDGQLFFKEETGNYWRVFPFFAKTSTFETVKNAAQAYEAARAYGAFSKALADIDIEQLHLTIPHFHDGIRRMRLFETALKAASENKIGQAILEIQFTITHCDIFQKIADLELPVRVTHNDTKISNILFDWKGENALAVIDWDTIMPGTVLSDFGDMVRTFANTGEEDATNLEEVKAQPEIVEALLKGYLEEMEAVLTPLEKDNLLLGAKWITLMQAMRFLTDFLENDVYYKTEYIGHNWVRARNQIALFKSL
jgi:thiamine kinase-like enzyme